MEKRIGFLHSIIWKIGAAFLLILLILSIAYSYISAFTAEMYFQEAIQNLNAEVASHIASEADYFIDGRINEAVLKNTFHNVMIINPSLEVYLLNNKGEILSYYAPNKTIKMKSIPLEPIEEFLSKRGKSFIMGPDPKNENTEKVFSASRVFENGKAAGFIYVILGSEEYENSLQMLLGSYIMRLGVRTTAITLIAAAVTSFIALIIITRNLRKIIHVIREFKNGNLNARINVNGRSELAVFAGSFNEMADTIVRNLEEMKTMDNLRRELVANVSHDLRTPLSIIQGYIETILMKAENLSETDRKRYMQTILRSTERLKKLVEELFELSKLEARETKPKPEAFSIAELAQDIQQKNLIIAEEKGINLQLKFSYDLPMIYADIGMMEKVLQNLLDNSLKFTHEGGKITISLEKEENNVLVKIEDTGSGIKPDEALYIFDRYHRSKRIEDAEKGGLGLGLAIVKKILEVHNLDIKIKSEEGKGTAFSFKIPVYSASNKITRTIPA
jgi:signal transduction histidine kinase